VSLSFWRAGLKALAALALAGCSLASGHAAEDPPGRWVIDSGWAALRDASGTLTLEQVRDAELAKSFVPQTGAPRLGYLRGAVWLRNTIRPPASAFGEAMLELQFPAIDEATLFWPRPDGGFDEHTAGDFHLMAQRDFEHRNIVFRVGIVDDRPVTFYVRLQGSHVNNFNVVLWTPQRFLSAALSEQLLWGLLLALHGILILTNLWAFLSTRDTDSGLFALFISVSFVSISFLEGFGHQYLLDGQPALNDALVVTFWMLTPPAAYLFLLRYVGLIGAHTTVRWPSWLVAVLTGWAVAVIAIDQALHPLWTRPAYTATQLVSVFLLPMILAWRGWVQHVRDAQLMLLASLPSLLGVGLRLGRNLGFLPPHPITDSAYYFGLAAYLLLLNYNVSNRYLTLRRKKEEAQALALAASKRAEQELEKRVAQRTADIEAAMRQVQTSLELERKLLSDHRAFYATVSHELRTPLAVINATAENLAMLDGQAQASTLARYRKILDASQRLGTLLDRYLQQDRFDRSAGVGRSSPTDLRLLLEDAGRAARLAGQGQRIQVEVTDAAEPFICDEVLTRLALNSLAENAAKYTPPGASILVRGRVATQAGGRQALLEIIDDGPGISSDDLAQVFEPAFRGANASGVPGTGMGLPLAQRMIELQGGSIRLDSGAGGGTRATVVLPEGFRGPTDAPVG
jgi:signal transduction histidine kinase